MTKQEYLNIGYIRSNCLSKVASLVKGLPVTQFFISRSRRQKTIEKSDYPWLQFNLVGTGFFDITYNIWKHKIPFQTVINELTKFKQQYNYEDFVVNKIEIGIKNKNLTKIINKLINENNEKKTYPDNTTFFMTFKNTPLAYDIINGWDAKVVKNINLNAIINLKFKRGVLDLKHIASGEKRRNKGLVENLDVFVNNKDIARLILHQLNMDKWFQFPEVLASYHPDTGKHPLPGAIRIYERKHGFSKWSFLKEEEVN